MTLMSQAFDREKKKKGGEWIGRGGGGGGDWTLFSKLTRTH